MKFEEINNMLESAIENLISNSSIISECLADPDNEKELDRLLKYSGMLDSFCSHLSTVWSYRRANDED